MSDNRYLEELLDRRAKADALFYTYSDPRVMQANIPVLSQMALVAGRLDVLIRREQARTRKPKESK